MKPKYVYVASSWKNLHQPSIVAALRSAGIECYDFRNPSLNNYGFSWKSIDTFWQEWTPKQWRKALHHPIAQNGYLNDKTAMDKADCCLLVLPCGRSAHMEAAFMAAQNKRVYTLALEQTEPDLMNLLLGPPEHILTSMSEMFDALEIV